MPLGLVRVGAGDEGGAGMGGFSVPQEALSGRLVVLPPASSQDVLQMRRLKAAEHRLMFGAERMSIACDKCANQCSRSDDEKGKGRVCCQCMSREGTGTQECKRCWQRILGN